MWFFSFNHCSIDLSKIDMVCSSYVSVLNLREVDKVDNPCGSQGCFMCYFLLHNNPKESACERIYCVPLCVIYFD
jgi:hypothetical protein